jgi:hypothetical protein
MTFLNTVAMTPPTDFSNPPGGARPDGNPTAAPNTPSTGSIGHIAQGSTHPLKDDVARIIDILKFDPMQAARELAKLILRLGGPAPFLKRLVNELQPQQLRDLQQGAADALKNWPVLMTTPVGAVLDVLLNVQPAADTTLPPKPNP